MTNHTAEKEIGKEHILVCLSSAPSNAKIVRTAAKMAAAFKGSFTALYVKTPQAGKMNGDDEKRLQDHTRLAEELGATITTVFGEDVSFQIAEFARLSGVTKIVIGRSAVSKRNVFGRPTLTEKLIAIAPDAEIYIIPDHANAVSSRIRAFSDKRIFLPTAKDVLLSILIVLVSTGIGCLLSALGFTEANIITLYILGVLMTSVIAESPLCWVASSVADVLIFNFLFVAPTYTLLAYDKGSFVTFAIMLVASLITGSLAGKLKKHARQSAKVAYRTKILFETTQLLQKAKDDADIVHGTAVQLKKLLNRSVVVYLCEEKNGEPRLCETDGDVPEEPEAVKWVARNRKNAGATTGVFPACKRLYVAVSANENVYGVVGILIGDQAIESFENSVMLSILGECALALENKRNETERERAAVLAKNEQLRADLLRSISHDLRTPLTSISGNASNLLSNGDSFDPETKNQIYTDIYRDSMWLVNLVENLLFVTRIEDGKMQLNPTDELIDEVIAEALRHLNRTDSDHTITVRTGDELLLAKMDAKLIMQVILNLVDNALKYTPKGSEIAVSSRRQGDKILVSVADNGEGIADDKKERVFEMFYTGAEKITDSRRSLGLGLYLCRCIVSAHGGELTVSDNTPKGAVFTFSLPATEVNLHE